MLEYFRPPSDVRPLHGPLRVEFKTMLRNILTISNHYFHTNHGVLNTHLLVRLIKSVYIATDDDAQYRRIIRTRLDDSAQLFGLGTDYHAARLIQDDFVGGIDRCLIHLDMSYPEVTTAPVTVISHPFTNTSLPLLNGTFQQLPPKGVLPTSTYSINGLQLLLKYHLYQKVVSNELPHKGARHFVYTWVLPQMMLSWYQLALWNRAWYPLVGIPFTREGNNLPIGTLSLNHLDIDKLNTVRDMRIYCRNTYGELVNYAVDRYYGVTNPLWLPRGIPYTRPTSTFIMVSRIRDIRGLLLLGSNHLAARDGDTLVRLRRSIALGLNSRWISNPDCVDLLRRETTLVMEFLAIKGMR